MIISCESMVELGIQDGDTLVDRSIDACPGPLVVDMVDGEVVVKRYEMIGNRCYLCSGHSYYAPAPSPTSTARCRAWCARLSTSTPIGLVEYNNFCVSCESVLQPGLESLLLGVMSNNVGYVIVRSTELNTLGMKMGIWPSKLQQWVRQMRHSCRKSEEESRPRTS